MFKQITKNLPDILDIKLQPYFQQIKLAKERLMKELQNNKIAALNIAFKEDDLKGFKEISQDIRKFFKRVIILGVGGSSLGAKTITSIKENYDLKIDFFESIDATTIKNKISNIDFKQTFFLVISKSGNTIETTCQTLIIIEKFKENNISNFSRNFLFVTENKESDIGKIAAEIGSQIKDHPKYIGGRFSYLSIVGLLPACLAGSDLLKIRQGAKKTLEDFLKEDVKYNKISEICALQLFLFDNGYRSNVIMPYIDSLKDFTDWYRQLWSESLGKKGFGSTPINSMGTIDQHSQLQLYLDGPRDKFFTFIINKQHDNNFLIKDLAKTKTRFGDKTILDIIKIEQESTIDILANKNLPIRIIELEKLDEEVLSSLMMQMFLETILIAYAKNINPFDQEAVEERKILAKKYLEKHEPKEN